MSDFLPGHPRPATPGSGPTTPTASSEYIWQYKGAGCWHNFLQGVGDVVEAGYQARAPHVSFNVAGMPYTLDFQQMQQAPLAQPNRKRAVRRIQASSSSYERTGPNTIWEHKGPEHWQPFAPKLDDLVEKAYQAGALVVRLEIGGELYDVDFTESKQYRVSDEARSREVRCARPHRVARARHLGSKLMQGALGVRVQRGVDWAWGDQDGGEGATGTTTPDESGRSGWLGVRWDCGATNSYRVGSEGKFDLAMATRLPVYWKPQPSKFVDKVECSELVAKQVQNFFDRTYSTVQTRDRRQRAGQEQVPGGYTVLRVLRNENRAWWANYKEHRAEVQEGCLASPKDAKWQWDPVLTWKARLESQALDRRSNEVYLYHGTSIAAAESISSTCFNPLHVKSGLLGKVFCFAESVTKADEYSPATDSQHVLLICRVALGCVRYTCDVRPDVTAMENDLANGRFHSVLADRKQTSGYREFAVKDPEKIFPEYLVFYGRR